MKIFLSGITRMQYVKLIDKRPHLVWIYVQITSPGFRAGPQEDIQDLPRNK